MLVGEMEGDLEKWWQIFMGWETEIALQISRNYRHCQCDHFVAIE